MTDQSGQFAFPDGADGFGSGKVRTLEWKLAGDVGPRLLMLANGEIYQGDGTGTLTLLAGGGGGGVTDHGLLTGLADDDHTQYALADGSRGAFDASGAASAAIATHVAAGDPHTGYELESALTEDVQDIVGALLSAGVTGLVTVTYNDGANTLKVDLDTAVLDERTQDQIGAHAKGGTLIGATYDDVTTGDTTLAVDTATLDERVMDTIATMLAAGTNISLSYNDAGNALTITGTGTTDATAIAYAIALG